MNIIQHRVNTVDQLISTPSEYGVEIDIRTNAGKLILHHDPFEHGCAFEEWLDCYKHKTIILNVKEEGLETEILKLMKDRNIEDFFFLDQSIPFLLKTSTLGEKRSAVRVSEYEGLHCAHTFSNLVDWAWVDCFKEFSIDKESALELKTLGYKLCIVSPELQGRDPEHEVPHIRKIINDFDFNVDSVCTKRPDLWS